MPDQLTWSHIIELLKIKNHFELKYYINISIIQKLTYRQLGNKIKNKEYERLSDEAKNKLISNESLNIKDTIPEPVLIPISKKYDKEKLNEKLLHTIIVDNIKEFMKQLGIYMDYIDKRLKTNLQNKTIGIILAKKNNEYVLYSTIDNIIFRTFNLIGGTYE